MIRLIPDWLLYIIVIVVRTPPHCVVRMRAMYDLIAHQAVLLYWLAVRL